MQLSFFVFEARQGREREWGGDEDGTYPPALPKWEGGLLRDSMLTFHAKTVLAPPL